MGAFFAELKRRHLYRVAAAYAVVAWVLLQIVNNVAPGLNLPNSAVTLVIVLLAAGFPIALIFAWVLEMRAPSAAVANGQAKTTPVDWILSAALVAVIVLIVYQQFAQPPAARPTVASVTPPPPAPQGIAIAVLPFTNLSSDKEQEFFSDGMTEEITSALAKVPNLQVVGRTSAFEFKGQNKDLRAIGQALGATHLIEGSVRKAGDRVRITAQLIRADNGLHLWTENYDRELTDIFAIQEEIAQAIAGALRVPLGLQQGDTLVSNRTSDLASYDRYLRARALFRARAISDAIKILEPVVARDPGFAPAWALLTSAYALTPVYSPQLRSGSFEEARRVAKTFLDKAEMAAREVLRLDSRNSDSYEAMAFFELGRGHWAASEDSHKQALALDPNNTEALMSYSVGLAATGRVKDALSIGEKLRRLDPFVPQYSLITADIMQAGGQSDASIPIIEAITGDAAGVYYRSIYLAQAYAAAGRYNDAADALLAIKGENLVSQRSVQDAARLLRLAPAKVKDPQNLPKLQGELYFVYAHIGAPERTLEYPERLFELDHKDPLALVSLWSPEFAQVRKTERFKAWVRKSGLVDYWKARGWPDLCRPIGTDDFVCD